MKTKKRTLLILLYFMLPLCFLAQPILKLPQASQYSEVKQTIGLTDVKITYHSPLVNGRKIWGDVIPYGKVWRAGANDNSTITFSTDVKINGSLLAAGTYGLHMIPNQDEWTIIFSKNYTSWGSFFYKQDEDALRVTAKPETREFQEWLDYNFTDRLPASSKVTLSWEKLKVSFTVEVDVVAITLKRIKEQLRNTAAFGWHAWEEAAHFCIVNKTNYDEALKWIDRSILIEENYTNLVAKKQLLNLMTNPTEADKITKRIMVLLESGTENKVNLFGYELMGENDNKFALEVLKFNLKKHPDSWNAYDSIAEAYKANGDDKQSLINYKTALAKAPQDQKERIQRVIDSLEKK
jgi:tetratricopeptide (TPR) repeat protein